MNNVGTEVQVIEKLTKRNNSLAVAESCTGGLIANRLTNVPGASKCFIGGIVAYSNMIKTRFLGVSNEILEEFGAVSALVAELMATQVRILFEADWGIGVTGIAGPTGGSENKPVGTVYIAVSNKHGACVHHYCFSGSREEIKFQTSEQSLLLLWEMIT